MPDYPRNWLQRLLRPTPDTDDLPTTGSFEAIGPYYDELMSAVPYRAWVDYVEEILHRMGARPATVLDLACGTGKVGAEIALRGYPRVFGVDLSESMVRVAAKRRRLSAAVQDARALGLRPASFDLVVCLYDSLNYLVEPSGLLECFRRVRDCLRPAGLFVFDLNTIRALALDLFTQSNLRSAGPLAYSWRSSWDEDTRMCTIRMWFRWHDADEEHEFVEIHRQRGHSDQEVQALLGEAGLAVCGVYDGYSFDPLHDRSTRVFYVARPEST